jgi:hypothetical protein
MIPLENLRIYAEIQSCVARVEAMKAENAIRIQLDESPAYGHQYFDYEASLLGALVTEIETLMANKTKEEKDNEVF